MCSSHFFAPRAHIRARAQLRLADKLRLAGTRSQNNAGSEINLFNCTESRVRFSAVFLAPCAIFLLTM